MKTPTKGNNPPFKNKAETDENNNIKNMKNKTDNIIEIPLLNIIYYTY